MNYFRFVALGDSQTEGLNDLAPDGSPRGWADRFAERLAATSSPQLQYANLAVRRCRAAHVRHVQLPAALSLQPDLAAVAVGMNDVLRHDFDLESAARDIEETVAALRDTGCDVLTMTFPDIGRMIPSMRWLRAREVALNERITRIARRYDVALLDLFPLAMCGDRRLWSHDRIHGSSEGHWRIAAGIAELAGLPGADAGWRRLEPSSRRTGRAGALARDGHWALTFMAPWLGRQLGRRLLGRAPGAAPVAKRPALTPVLAVRPTGRAAASAAGAAT
ncbi:SGNH/GDSL hydrolase family protein [Nocardioides terrisoli]|uniref:SGNH/GDSL hydrolase family protein n=1 Tax=Nocardioides terrisoli TaxID=3388267 RepID=UPI00287B919C|nr:SGNH/GDSL hydrolase family protein [Nocardioides marmorisolisilvae]